MPALTAQALASTVAFPGLRPLAELVDRRWIFLDPGVDNHGCVIEVRGILVWPDGSSDALRVVSETNAATFRLNGLGDRVWECEGTVSDVVAALVDLSAPGTRGAPTLVIGAPPPRPARSPSGLWIPQSTR